MIIEGYREKSTEINLRLNEFRNLPGEFYFREFLFCLLTPQSNAKKCWEAVEEISLLKELEEKKVNEILRTKTRFHNTKTIRIIENAKKWGEIKGRIAEDKIVDLRNWLVQNIDGYGLKESSHFIRNIGKSNNEIAILDRHILRNLVKFGIIKDEKIKNNKNYLEIEKAFIKFAEENKITPDELDLLWWSQENGEIFK
ncbi:DNA lyase [Candidatus Pacearchaeota archaeon]|nr:DNA lyase [Candidatus Pacearchaeota archaeon]